uniref:Putative LAGLIDADG homing endonuclease n=1 Tax=Uvulifera verrucariae TaxID=381758 RepID=A0A167V5I3_9CHLO|nr:putative LAGLIDADG homing endonuclease [Uvulifera verrucariae]
MKNSKKRECIGSSETTREPPHHSNFVFDDYRLHHCPDHAKNRFDQAFLEWFVGFSEGDGTFSYREEPQLRFLFEIGQKDPKILYKIRNILGFGRVSFYTRDCASCAEQSSPLLPVRSKDSKDSKTNVVLFEKSKNSSSKASPSSTSCAEQGQEGQQKTYWRFSVEDKRGLQRIMSLFNGNLVLPKRQSQFKEWVLKGKRIQHPNFLLSDRKTFPSLETGWLSGFLEAEGCFYAGFTRPAQRYTISSRLIQKVTITQKDEAGEREILESIGQLLGSNSKLSLAKKPDSYRIELSSLKSHQIIIFYMKKFPLQGEKGIAFRRWWRVYLFRVKKDHLTEKGILKMRRLCRKINETAKEFQNE